MDLNVRCKGIKEKTGRTFVISFQPKAMHMNRYSVMLLASIVLLSLLAVWTHYQPIPALDKSTMLYFRSAVDPARPIGPEWLAVHFRDITTLGSNWFLLLLTALAAITCAAKGHRDKALFILITVISGIALSFALKYGFHRPRPELVPHITKVYTSSFPSGHAMSSSLTYACLISLALHLVKERILQRCFVVTAVIIVMLVGISRVFLGVHWPTDILAGWSAGLGWFCLCRMLMSKLAQGKPA